MIIFIESLTWGCFLLLFFNRTEKDWDNSLIIKRVLFEVFDCFLPLFYIAFYQLNVVALRRELVGLFWGMYISYKCWMKMIFFYLSFCKVLKYNDKDLNILKLKTSIWLDFQPSCPCCFLIHITEFFLVKRFRIHAYKMMLPVNCS